MIEGFGELLVLPRVLGGVKTSYMLISRVSGDVFELVVNLPFFNGCHGMRRLAELVIVPCDGADCERGRG